MKPTATQIRDIAPAVRYEIKLFIELYTRLVQGETPVDWVASNARLEAWLLHARNLITFFETAPKQRYKDDVLSEDYGFSARPLLITKRIRDRFNKDLAHLTFSRIARTRNTSESRKAKLWNFKDFSPLLERCDAFVQHMRSEYLSSSGDAPELSEYTMVHSGVLALLAKLGH